MPEFSEIITSINGIPSRQSLGGDEVGHNWFENCLASWFKLSQRVVSVSERRLEIDNVVWVGAESRPTIVSIINAMSPIDGKHSLFTNGDIFIANQFIESMGHIDKNALYISQRVDVTQNSKFSNEYINQGIYKWGYDVFVFPENFINLIKTQNLMPEAFKIGEPWWDYAIPVLAISAGIPVYLIDNKPPAVFHYSHPTTNWDETSWLNLGSIFIKLCEHLQKDASQKSAHLVSDILGAYHEQQGTTTNKLHAVSGKLVSLISELPIPAQIRKPFN